MVRPAGCQVEVDAEDAADREEDPAWRVACLEWLAEECQA
jgi:hypothetical protein